MPIDSDRYRQLINLGIPEPAARVLADQAEFGVVGSISDVPGLEDALDAVPSDLNLLLAAHGDMLVDIGGENVALAGTASASSGTVDGPAAGLIDGLEGPHGYPNGMRLQGLGGAGSAAGNWGKVDLGSSIEIGHVRVLMGTASDRLVNHYDVQYSNDNTTWTTAASADGTPVVRDLSHNFDTPIFARYWRVLLGQSSGHPDNGADIVEFQIFATHTLARMGTTDLGRANLAAGGSHGILLPVFAADPASPTNGETYINSVSGKVRSRIAGAWVDLN